MCESSHCHYRSGEVLCIHCSYGFTGVVIRKIRQPDSLIYIHTMTLATENIDTVSFIKDGRRFLLYVGHRPDLYIDDISHPWIWCFLDQDRSTHIQFEDRVVVRTMQRRFLYRRWKRRLIRHRLNLPRLSIPLTYLVSFLR